MGDMSDEQPIESVEPRVTPLGDACADSDKPREEESTPSVCSTALAEEPAAELESAHGIQESPPEEPHPPASPAARQEIVAGTIHAVVDSGKTVVVELPGAVQGVIEAGVFEKLPRIGTRMEFVVQADAKDAQGRARLLLADRADRVTWKDLEVGMVLDAMVTGMNTGGLEMKIAGSKIRAFLPASQIDLAAVEDPTPLLSHKFPVKILSLDKRNRKVVVSRRAILVKEHRKQRMKEIEIGQELSGKVRKIEEFGVFVDLEPGLDGLVHMDDLAWGYFDQAQDVVQVGQEVKVKVLHVERGRLVLGIRQTLPDPWKQVETKYPLGQKVKVKVVKTLENLAIVELEQGVEGSIHISQVSERRVESVDKALREGQQVEAKVMEHDARRRRISLSIRALTSPDEAIRAPQASREEIRKYVKSPEKARAMQSLMAKFGDTGGLKGGIG